VAPVEINTCCLRSFYLSRHGLPLGVGDKIVAGSNIPAASNCSWPYRSSPAVVPANVDPRSTRHLRNGVITSVIFHLVLRYTKSTRHPQVRIGTYREIIRGTRNTRNAGSGRTRRVRIGGVIGKDLVKIGRTIGQ